MKTLLLTSSTLKFYSFIKTQPITSTWPTTPYASWSSHSKQVRLCLCPLSGCCLPITLDVLVIGVMWLAVSVSICSQQCEEISLPIVLHSHGSLKDWTTRISRRMIVCSCCPSDLKTWTSSPMDSCLLLELICVYIQGFSLIPYLFIDPEIFHLFKSTIHLHYFPGDPDIYPSRLYPPTPPAQRSNNGSNLIQRWFKVLRQFRQWHKVPGVW